MAENGGSDRSLVAGNAREPLTAEFRRMPPAHDGEGPIRFRLAFSKDIAIGDETLRDESFAVTGGRVTVARRMDGRDDLWDLVVEVERDSREAVTITLPGGRACGTNGAVCTGGDDPAPLGNSLSATVRYSAVTLFTQLYWLGVETVEFEPFAGENAGGAIEPLADDLLLATPGGRLALIRSNGAVEYLAGQVPMNRSAVESLDLEPVVEGRFRVADILLKEDVARGGELFVTHHHFAGECGYRFRLSSTTLLRDEEGLPVLSPWKTIFDAEPCLTVATLRQGNQAGGKMLTDGPDHLLVLIGDHGKDGLGRVGSARYPLLPQDPGSHIGKLVRIAIGTGAAEVLTLGHRNPQGFARGQDGDLWATEHGPFGGDELNLIEPHNNYGWPHVSYGFAHSGGALNDSDDLSLHDGFTRPAFAWVPSIGISGLVVNDAGAFPLWRDDLLVASLRARSLFRVRRSGETVRYVEQIEIRTDTLDGRIRDLTQMADGRLALLVDRSRIVFLRPLGGPGFDFIADVRRGVIEEGVALEGATDPVGQERAAAVTDGVPAGHLPTRAETAGPRTDDAPGDRLPKRPLCSSAPGAETDDSPRKRGEVGFAGVPERVDLEAPAPG